MFTNYIRVSPKVHTSLRAASERWLTIQSRAVELGFKKPSFLKVFLKETSKAQMPNLGFWVFWCRGPNLINKPHIKILMVICEIHQFHLRFSRATWCSSSLTGDLNRARSSWGSDWGFKKF